MIVCGAREALAIGATCPSPSALRCISKKRHTFGLKLRNSICNDAEHAKNSANCAVQRLERSAFAQPKRRQTRSAGRPRRISTTQTWISTSSITTTVALPRVGRTSHSSRPFAFLRIESYRPLKRFSIGCQTCADARPKQIFSRSGAMLYRRYDQADPGASGSESRPN